MLINSLNFLVDKKGSPMKFNIEGKLRKMPAVKNYRLPLFEAVSNSIQSIQLRQKNNPSEKDFSGKVSVYVKFKAGTKNLGKSEGIVADGGIIDSFRIVDNGEGFTEENFESFDTMDTLLKQAAFACKGEGRFLWLKSFQDVRIQSIFKKENELFERNFSFDKSGSFVHQDEPPKAVPLAKGLETTVTLSGIVDAVANKKPIELNDIAEALLSHFILDLLSEDAPEIFVIEEGTNSKVVVNDKLRDCVIGSSMETERKVKGISFKLTGQKLKKGAIRSKIGGVYWSAGKRIVEVVKLSEQVQELSEQLSDPDTGEVFSYVAAVSSSFLDDCVDSSRTKIMFPKDSEITQDSWIPSEKDIKEAVATMVREQLSDSLKEIRSRGKQKLVDYVENVGPEFREYLNADPDLYISPSASEKEVRDFLTVNFAEFEVKQNHKVDELLKIDWDASIDPKKEIEELQKTISPVNLHSLSKFASKRKFYVDLLDKVCRYKDSIGKEHYYEEALHSLIYPKGKDSTDQNIQHNLWLIDESLAFHHYLASDKEFKVMKCVKSESGEAPDIMSMRLYGDNDADHVAEFVFVEFKRPGRKNYGSQQDPIKQILDYVKELRKSTVNSRDGIQLNSEHCPIYYYLICDVDESLKDCLENEHDFDPNALHDHFYGFKAKLKVFIEVLTLTALRREAKERNRALLAAAGLRS